MTMLRRVRENMNARLKTMANALGAVLKTKRQLAIAIFSSLFTLALALYIPVLTIPGNTIEFQLSLVTWDYAALLVLFSALFGISISLHVYPSPIMNKNHSIVKGAGTGFAGIMGTLFAGKLCPLCLGTILGFIGLGGSALYLFSFRNEILVASMLILLASIYFGSKRIAAICEKCKQ